MKMSGVVTILSLRTRLLTVGVIDKPFEFAPVTQRIHGCCSNVIVDGAAKLAAVEARGGVEEAAPKVRGLH